MAHSNYQQRAFEMASNTEFNMAAPIIIRSEEEAQTVLMMGQYFRRIENEFGKRTQMPDLPPPVLRFFMHITFTKMFRY